MLLSLSLYVRFDYKFEAEFLPNNLLKAPFITSHRPLSSLRVTVKSVSGLTTCYSAND